MRSNMGVERRMDNYVPCKRMRHTGEQIMKPKFKISLEHLLRFNTDCAEAILGCPQVRVGDAYIFDREILLQIVDAETVIEYWIENDILWDKGYHEDLLSDTVEVLELYKDHLAKLRLFEREHHEA